MIKMRHHGDVLLTSPCLYQLKAGDASGRGSRCLHLPRDVADAGRASEVISSYLLYDRNWKKLSPLKKMIKEMALLKGHP